jgi:hypothetical protein
MIAAALCIIGLVVVVVDDLRAAPVDLATVPREGRGYYER